MTHTPFFYEELWRKAGRASLEIPPPRLDRVGVGDTGRGGGGVGSTFRFSTKCSILFYGSRRGGSGVGVCIIVAKKSKKAWILCVHGCVAIRREHRGEERRSFPQDFCSQVILQYGVDIFCYSFFVSTRHAQALGFFWYGFRLQRMKNQ